MSDVQFQTLSDSNSDPSPFEFDISALPQPINGFRPTAHVIIDTKNLDQEMVYNLENQLYGTYNMDAHIPTIQSLFDLMNFGDLVVVRDNGDGTWQAEGSYKHVSVDPDTGEFTIDNIVSQDNGDGTYKFAGTNETLV